MTDETLHRILVFRGRTARRTYWLWALAGFVGFVVAAGIHPAFGSFVLALLAVPAVVLSIRRLHDAGSSGWHLFWGFVPYVGMVVVIVMLAQRGQGRTNRFGPPTRRPTPPPAPSPPPVTPASAPRPVPAPPAAPRPQAAPTLAQLRAAIPGSPATPRPTPGVTPAPAPAPAPQAAPSLDALRAAVTRRLPTP